MASPGRPVPYALASLAALVAYGVLTGTPTPAGATPGVRSVVPDPDTGGWSVRPAELIPGGPRRTALSVDGSIGALRTDQLRLTNHLPRPLAFTVITSTLHTPDGVPTYGKPELMSDAASWVRLPAASRLVTVPPDSSVDVPVEVRFPNTARTGERLAGVTVRRIDTGERRHVPLRIRTNGPLAAELTVDRSDLEVRTSRWDPTRPARASLDIVVRNTGNTVMTGPVTVQLDTLFDRKAVLRADDRELTLEPGATYRARVSGSAWPTFALTPEVEMAIPTGQIDDNGDPVRRPISAAATNLTVLPVAHLTWLGVAVIAVGAAWWWARDHARRRARRMGLLGSAQEASA